MSERKWYKLVFKQNQPIHVGKSNWGVINETEIFIPGWTMWGALTNAYLRAKRFQDIGNTQTKFEVITNFFPSFDKSKILNPKYKDGEFYLGDFSEREFRLFFVDSSLKTAVEPIFRKAKDEHLYEFDYILPVPKKEFRKNLEDKGFINELYWIGLIYLEEEVANECFHEGKILKKVFVGGDTKYGFGELELIESIELNREKYFEEFENWNINIKEENGREFELYINTSKEIRNYLRFVNIKKDGNKELPIKFVGEIKLLAEFNFVTNIPTVKDAGFFITPGSLIIDDSFLKEKSFTLKKGKFQQINKKDL